MIRMKKLPEFFEYVKSAKHAIGEIKVPNYEQHFQNLENFDPSLGFLDRNVFIVDFRINKFLYLSPNTSSVIGHDQAECLKMGPMGIMELMHPIDVGIITTKFFVEGHELIKQIKSLDISRIKVSYSYRLTQKDGTYKTLLQQFSHLMLDEDYNPLVIMGTNSDLSDIHTKPELFGRIHQLNAKGKWDKLYERFYSLVDVVEDYNLTPKEYEIIKFVHKGLSSKEIANMTNRSEETIKSQRKSILAKTNCQTMTDVIVLSLRNGWI